MRYEVSCLSFLCLWFFIKQLCCSWLVVCVDICPELIFWWDGSSLQRICSMQPNHCFEFWCMLRVFKKNFLYLQAVNLLVGPLNLVRSGSPTIFRKQYFLFICFWWIVDGSWEDLIFFLSNLCVNCVSLSTVFCLDHPHPMAVVLHILVLPVCNSGFPLFPLWCHCQLDCKGLY